MYLAPENRRVRVAKGKEGGMKEGIEQNKKDGWSLSVARYDMPILIKTLNA